ncbi:MAG: hypothetical protein LBL45_03815, partial [Treponema sp.]|nr:hypothetical protein [Treponema sp.]
LALAPPSKAKPLYKFILAITAALNDDTLRSNILSAKTSDEIVRFFIVPSNIVKAQIRNNRNARRNTKTLVSSPLHIFQSRLY